jgi:molecular chaperone DnaJ
MENPTLYDTLRVSPYASEEEIRKAYRTLALVYHPDSCGSVQHRDDFINIKEAFKILSDPEKRKAYDKTQRIHERQWEKHDPFALPKHDANDMHRALSQSNLESLAQSNDLLKRLHEQQAQKPQAPEPTEPEKPAESKLSKVLGIFR